VSGTAIVTDAVLGAGLLDMSLGVLFFMAHARTANVSRD
jgi:hypothetical protein